MATIMPYNGVVFEILKLIDATPFIASNDLALFLKEKVKQRVIEVVHY